MAQDDYIMLMASLPNLGPMLAAKQAPINPVRFAQRLRALKPEDLATLEKVADLLAWRRMRMGGDDASFVVRAQAVLRGLESPTLIDLVRKRMATRTLVAALRRRHAGQDAPRSEEVWGLPPLSRRVAAAWREPGFGMDRQHPWLAAARDRLEKEDAVGLERILLETAWTQAARLAAGHSFDFEAVTLYAVKLNLLTRWTRYDAEAAASRFKEIVAEALDAAPPALREMAAATKEAQA